MSYKVRLPVFEGPFDLLVYLIEASEMDIYDIPIAEITGQYLEVIDTMEVENAGVASEFMVLAAELIRIKTRMMLPGTGESENQEREDPRESLVERLLEYKKCRALAGFLGEREDKMRRVFTKPQEDISVYLENPEEYLKLGPEEFSAAFRDFLSRRQRMEETRRHYEVVRRRREKLERRIDAIRCDMIRAGKEGRKEVSFRELIPEHTGRQGAVATFAALLQLINGGFLEAEQDSAFGEIRIAEGGRDLSEYTGEVDDQQSEDQVGS